MRYHHVQKSVLHWLLVLPGAIALWVSFLPGIPLWVELLVFCEALLLLTLGSQFRKFTITDDGENLRAFFGDSPLMGVCIPYDKLQDITPGMLHWFKGPGMNWSFRTGWTCVAWGRGCVRVTLTNGRRYTLGTPEPDVLAQFLENQQIQIANSPVEPSHE